VECRMLCFVREQGTIVGPSRQHRIDVIRGEGTGYIDSIIQ
jgi:hypothetical protein